MTIYLTEQDKKEFEDKVSELNKLWELEEDTIKIGFLSGQLNIFESLLSQAVVLPVEESWNKLAPDEVVPNMLAKFRNGVIIKPNNK